MVHRAHQRRPALLRRHRLGALHRDLGRDRRSRWTPSRRRRPRCCASGHAIAAGGTDDFTIADQAQLLESVDSISSLLTILLAGIASISLVVGGIGIMNIMLVSVRERTREIGIRKAIGARGRDILAQFLVEALTLSVLGGLIGVVAGCRRVRRHRPGRRLGLPVPAHDRAGRSRFQPARGRGVRRLAGTPGRAGSTPSSRCAMSDPRYPAGHGPQVPPSQEIPMTASSNPTGPDGSYPGSPEGAAPTPSANPWARPSGGPSAGAAWLPAGRRCARPGCMGADGRRRGRHHGLDAAIGGQPTGPAGQHGCRHRSLRRTCRSHSGPGIPTDAGTRPAGPSPHAGACGRWPVRRRTATARLVDGLLVISLVVAAGGVGYAVGRQTAPSTPTEVAETGTSRRSAAWGPARPRAGRRADAPPGGSGGARPAARPWSPRGRPRPARRVSRPRPRLPRAPGGQQPGGGFAPGGFGRAVA